MFDYVQKNYMIIHKDWSEIFLWNSINESYGKNHRKKSQGVESFRMILTILESKSPPLEMFETKTCDTVHAVKLFHHYAVVLAHEKHPSSEQ